jgi:RimJ/RimL family protein N-acetyltransferase
VHALPRLIADVDPRNAASIRLLERLGFCETHRATKTILVGERWCDSVYFALECEAWSELHRTA